MYEGKEPSKPVEIPMAMASIIEQTEGIKIVIQDLENRLEGILRIRDPEVEQNEKFVSQYKTKMARELEAYALMLSDIRNNAASIISRLEL